MMKNVANYLSVLVCVLEGLDEPEGLIDRAADGQVVHGDLSQHAAVVNDEQTPKRLIHVHVSPKSGLLYQFIEPT